MGTLSGGMILNLIVTNYNAVTNYTFEIFLDYGGNIFAATIQIKKGVVPYVVYDQELQSFLGAHMDKVKSMNKFAFALAKDEKINLPFEIK